jgi:predicted DNA-binding protein (UPF0251 family)/predicted Fe-Mo cluster-binding NifX family protein
VPRPRKCRTVSMLPGLTYFKPRGIPMHQLTEVYLPLEGFEALRLADWQGLDQAAAAAQMNVSRQTFGRILSQARHSVAEALVHGLALCIEGGDYVFTDQAAPVDTSLSIDARIAKINAKRNEPQKELKMEKIAISAESPNLDDPVDPRFGRAAGFLVGNPKTQELEFIDNGASQVMSKGAGIQAAEIVARAGADVVLTGYVGPKAFQALQAAGIKVVQNLENMTVREALERYCSGQIEIAAEPNSGGHGR